MHDELLLHSARLITTDARGLPVDVSNGWVHVRGGAVVATGAGERPDGVPVSAQVDARERGGAGAILTAGLVDIHNHGGGGRMFEEGPDAFADAIDAHARRGTTRIVASLVTAPADVLARQVGNIAAAVAADGALLGAHLEGPCLSPSHRGAHDPHALVAGAAMDFVRVATAGPVVQVTIAPELPGSLDAVAWLIRNGTVVAVGHTDADLPGARAAFDAGATLVTHTFNAMRPMLHRAPGPVAAAIMDDRITLEVIADGHHVDPLMVAMLFRSAPGRVALVTDAIAAAGADDGRYRLGGLEVEVIDGRATLAGTDVIAGSSLTLDRAVRNVIAWGVSVPAAVAAATSVPATAIGRADLGRLAVGARGDAVIWDSAMHPRAVWRDGVELPR